MKVYVLSIDWAHDGECESIYGCGVREVYADREQALVAMNKLIEQEYQDNDTLKQYDVERTATEFIAGERGCFSEEHFCVWLSERDLVEGE